MGKHLIVFEFTSIDRFIIEYKYRDKLLELKNKGCKIVFGFLSDPSYDESIENAKSIHLTFLEEGNSLASELQKTTAGAVLLPAKDSLKEHSLIHI